MYFLSCVEIKTIIIIIIIIIYVSFSRQNDAPLSVEKIPSS